MAPHERPWWVRYGIAIPAVLLGVLIRNLLNPYIQATPFQGYIIWVAVCAWYGGLGPGILATSLFALVSAYFFLPPGHSLTFGPVEITKLVLFTASGLTVSIFSEVIHRARRTAEKNAEALRETDERFSAAFTASPHGMAMYHPARQAFVMINRRFAECFGITPRAPEEVDAAGLSILTDDGETKPLLTMLKEHGHLRNFPARILQPSGTTVDASFFIESITLRNEKVVLIAFEDVTESKRAQEARVESERKYREIVEGTNAMLFTTDLRGRFTYVNDAAAEVLGYPPSELIGKFYLRFVDPRDREWVHQVYSDQLIGKRHTTYMEFRYRMPSGAEGWISFSVNPVLKGGTITGLSGVAQEITGRKQTEAALKASEEQHRQLFETMAQGVVYLDAHGEIIAANPAAASFFGVSENGPGDISEAISHWKLIREDGTPLPPEETPARVALRTGKEVRNFRVGLSDGQPKGTRWLDVNAIPQFRENETKPYRIYTTFADITAQQHAEEQIMGLNAELEERVLQRTEQLTYANKELESFSYSISHDLRAPLRGINGFAKILLEDFGATMDPEGARLLQSIALNAKQMGQLIDDLLAFSRLNRESMEKRQVPMSAMVLDIVTELKGMETSRSVDVRIDELPDALADAGLIRQVWYNLLSNAFKFTRYAAEPVIEVGSYAKDGLVIYYVKDNGAGFNMDYSGKLFGVFQRLHAADEFEGTGIGLALVQRIVHRHGGTVWADGKVNHGATFYFSLPTS